MNTVRVLALLPYPLNRAPGQRYRIEQWAPELSAAGVEVFFSPFFSPGVLDFLYQPGKTCHKVLATLRGYRQRVYDFLRATRFDVLFVYREAVLLAPAWLESPFARRRPLVFDFDDAIFLPAASEANAWSLRLRPAGKVSAICEIAQHVTVGNEFLADYARSRARRVSVVPTTIDTGAYCLRRREPNRVPVVGWTGTTTTLPYLQGLIPALTRLRQELDFEFQAVGVSVRVPGVRTGCRPWAPESEADDLRAFDVGLMPLTEDDWSRGKCGAKALQYMALGIPPVVSPVGVNARIVQDGVNGYWASTEEEWVDRVGRLLRDASLRARLGAEARRTVEREYSAKVQAPRMAELLRQAAGR